MAGAGRCAFAPGERSGRGACWGRDFEFGRHPAALVTSVSNFSGVGRTEPTSLCIIILSK